MEKVSGFDDDYTNFDKYLKALNEVQDLIVLSLDTPYDDAPSIWVKNKNIDREDKNLFIFVKDYPLCWGIGNDEDDKRVYLDREGVGYYLQALTTNLLETYDKEEEEHLKWGWEKDKEEYRRKSQNFKKELEKAIEKIDKFYKDNWVAMANEFIEFRQKNHIEPTKEELKKRAEDFNKTVDEMIEEVKKEHGFIHTEDIIDPRNWESDLNTINKTYDGKVYIEKRALKEGEYTIYKYFLVNMNKLGMRSDIKIDNSCSSDDEKLYKSIGLTDKDLANWKEEKEHWEDYIEF